MNWRETNDIKYKQFINEMKPFKFLSGQFQCRILGLSDIEGAGYFLKGSGGYLTYKNRYFLVTNYHVVEDLSLKKVIAPCVSNGRKIAKLIDDKRDSDSDIAVFEIDRSSIENFEGKGFINQKLIKSNPISYLKKYNPVFLHASPGEKSSINYESKEVNLTTFPYCTFAKGTLRDYLIKLSADTYGINEIGDKQNVPKFTGMSGSWAYSYHPKSLLPYKCIGLLSMGTPESGNIWAIKIDNIIEFINKYFF